MNISMTVRIILDEYRKLLTDRTRMVAIAHVSNALGTIVPLREVINAAHDAGAAVLVDGAQAVSHMPVDVQALDADFYVFSGHKVLGPTGIGALYGKADVLDSMPPWQGGGNMIRNVTFERAVYQPPPTRFEAGTTSIADAAGLGAALAYVERIGRTNIASYEQDLLGYATRALEAVPGLRLVGTAPDKAAILSFVLDGYRPEEVGSALNSEGIAVRAGHHCAQPVLRRFGLAATVRAALAMYNTHAEVDLLAQALHRLARRRRRVTSTGPSPNGSSPSGALGSPSSTWRWPTLMHAAASRPRSRRWCATSSPASSKAWPSGTSAPLAGSPVEAGKDDPHARSTRLLPRSGRPPASRTRSRTRRNAQIGSRVRPPCQRQPAPGPGALARYVG